MGLHAGLYTQQLLDRVGNVGRKGAMSYSEDVSVFQKDFLKKESDQITCPQCQQKFRPDGILREWLGEPEEGKG
jgi:hypothetical protein